MKSYTIFAWMHEELGLKNLEEKAYAMIFGFSQAPNTYYTGSFENMAKIIGCSTVGAFRAVQGLIKKGFVIREEESIPGTHIKKYRYKAVH